MRATIGRAALAFLLGFALLAAPARADDAPTEPRPRLPGRFPIRSSTRSSPTRSRRSSGRPSPIRSSR